MEPESDDFEMLAASLRADARDMSTFVEALASKLEGALPQQTHIERKGGGLFSKEKRVRRLQVDIGDSRYELALHDGRVDAVRAKAVRGIVLKRDVVPVEMWIDSLSREIAEMARGSEQARLALERLLGA